jgi:hypothetical protein
MTYLFGELDLELQQKEVGFNIGWNGYDEGEKVMPRFRVKDDEPLQYEYEANLYSLYSNMPLNGTLTEKIQAHVIITFLLLFGWGGSGSGFRRSRSIRCSRSCGSKGRWIGKIRFNLYMSVNVHQR